MDHQILISVVSNVFSAGLVWQEIICCTAKLVRSAMRPGKPAPLVIHPKID